MPQPKIFSPNGSFSFVEAEQTIDLNDQLVTNRSATFLMRVHSDAMQEAGICVGDVVLVDRKLEPKNGSVVIAALQGELVIRRYDCSGGVVRLVPASGRLAALTLDGTTGCTVWGVVTYVIRSV